MRKQLTAAMIAKLAPPDAGRLEIFDTIVPALALRVTSNGARSFVARGRIKGQAAPIRLTIGDASAMKLADARQAASAALQQMRAGNDPRPPKEAAGAVVLTFDGLIDEWSRLYLARNHSARYRNDTPATIRRGLRDLLSLPADKITKADAVNALDKIAHKPGALDKTWRCARACYGWAEKRDKVPSNPFAGLPDMPATGERERVLSDDEIADLWTAAGTLGYPWAPFYQLAMLTLQRRSTIAGMRWSEIADDFSLWRLPGARMKNGKPHDVHLSEPARAVLAAIPRIGDSDYVFTTTGKSPVSGYAKAKQRLDAAIAKVRTMAQWQPHDFRRSGVTWLAAAGFDSIVVDKILAHQPGKLRGVAGVYQRHDFARERAVALDAWAAHVTGLGAGDNVVSLRAAQ